MADTNALPIRIFYMNDMEWWIGAATPEQMKAAFIEEYGDDAYGDNPEMPSPLDDDALDKLFIRYDEEDASLRRTFREQLAIEISDGVDEPRMFACEEW